VPSFTGFWVRGVADEATLTSAMPHTVLIVEDDSRFRSAFVQAVHDAEDLTLVGEADDLSEGLRLLLATRPDVLLVDIGLPSGSGIELIQKANVHLPACDVMVITVFGDEGHVLACIEAGATGYLLKGSRGLEIAEQIRVLVGGGSPISPVIARQLLVRMGPPDAALKTKVALSTQEQAVLQMSSKGYSYQEIARMLGLSRHTVGTYVKRIYRKLQVHGKTEAVFEARRLGLVRG
jgi:DNA-binding NarL/FixJ family response regulator